MNIAVNVIDLTKPDFKVQIFKHSVTELVPTFDIY